jgi:hypothetical protein
MLKLLSVFVNFSAWKPTWLTAVQLPLHTMNGYLHMDSECPLLLLSRTLLSFAILSGWKTPL